MPERKPIDPVVEAMVLSKSARRCCLCFHLEGDLTEKLGQIAHLDHNPANSSEDNLAHLCLDHHSLYDSRTSQHKNYTIAEVKAARAELYETLRQGLHAETPKRPEKISLAKLPSTDPYLFGRERELAALDAAWDSPRTNIVTLVAFAGVGKTALVNVWLNRMGEKSFRGAERVFGWSFYRARARPKAGRLRLTSSSTLPSAGSGTPLPRKATPGRRASDWPSWFASSGHCWSWMAWSLFNSRPRAVSRTRLSRPCCAS